MNPLNHTTNTSFSGLVSNSGQFIPQGSVSFDKKPNDIDPHLKAIQESLDPINKIQESLNAPRNLRSQAFELTKDIQNSKYIDHENKGKLRNATKLLSKAIKLAEDSYPDLELLNSNMSPEEYDYGKEDMKWLHFDRGICHMRLKQYDMAIKDFSEEMKYHKDGPGLFRSLYERGLSHKEAGSNSMALRDFGLVEKLDYQDDLLLEATSTQIKDITQNTNIIFSYVSNIAESYKKFFTNLGLPNSILGLPRNLEKEFLNLDEEKVEKILDRAFDYKYVNKDEFSDFLKDNIKNKDLKTALNSSFELLTSIKNQIPSDDYSPSQRRDFINEFEKKTYSTYYELKKPSAEFEPTTKHEKLTNSEKGIAK